MFEIFIEILVKFSKGEPTIKILGNNCEGGHVFIGKEVPLYILNRVKELTTPTETPPARQDLPPVRWGRRIQRA